MQAQAATAGDFLGVAKVEVQLWVNDVWRDWPFRVNEDGTGPEIELYARHPQAPVTAGYARVNGFWDFRARLVVRPVSGHFDIDARYVIT